MLQRNKKNILKIFFWISLFGLACFLHSDHMLSSDEGVTLNGAWNLINGRQLYTDFFEYFSPGSFYLILIAWKIFGINFWVAKIASIIMIFLAAIGIFKISALVKRGTENYLAPVIFIVISGAWFITINHNALSLPSITWSIYFLAKGLNNGKIKNFVSSGIFAGVSVLFLQQRGLMLFSGLALFLLITWIIKKNKINFYNLIFFVISFFLPLLTLLFWPIKTAYYNLVVFPLFHYMEAMTLSKALFIITGLIILITASLLKFKKEKSTTIWLLIFIQLFLWLSIYPLPTKYHISLIIFPILIIILYLGAKSFKIKIEGGLEGLQNSLVVFGGITFLTIFTIINSTNSFIFSENNKREELINTIKNNCPGKYLYSGPFNASLYFETRKLNATPYSFLVTSQHTPEQFQDALNNIIEKNPSCVILNYRSIKLPAKNSSHFNHNQLNVFENYIKDNYQPYSEPIKGLIIYKKINQ
jgi:hypothetical protein